MDDVVATVVLDEGVRFLGRGTGDQAVAIDYPPPLGADRGLRGGLELLLMALAACTGQTAVPVLRKMRQDVTGCSVTARGKRRDTHPTVLTEIHLDIVVQGRGLDEASVRKGVQTAETGYCPVWAMLSPATPIHTSVRVEPAA